MYFERIRNLREDHDLLQREVANYLNISQQYYSQYELGKFTMLIELIIKLADYYKVSIDYIVNRTNKKEVNK